LTSYSFSDLFNYVESEEIVEMLSQMIKIPSYTGLKDQESEIANYMYQIFKKENIETQMIEVLPGRPNVYAYIRGNKQGQKLLLTGHSDTVPVYNMRIAPFSGEIRDSKVYGRGACDMKGSLAAMMGALITIKRAGIQLKGDLIFGAVIDEEERGKGTEFIVNNGPEADAAIVGEPTKLEIAAGHRGLEWLEIKVIGKTTHGGTPEKGINAISKAAKLISRIESSLLPKFKERKHPIIGEPILNLGVIQGGDQASSVAGECIIKIDRRWTPSESIAMVLDDFYRLFDEIKKEDPEFNAKIRRIYDAGDMLDHCPLEIDLNHPVVTSLSEGIKKIKNIEAVVTNFPAWTDGALLSNFKKIPCVVFGPGDLSNAHSTDECIEVDQLLDASKIYTLAALEFCGVERWLEGTKF